MFSEDPNKALGVVDENGRYKLTLLTEGDDVDMRVEFELK